MKSLLPLLFFTSTIISSRLYSQNKIDQNALDTLLKASELTQTDALIIYLDGKPYGEYYFGKQPKKIEAMSSTKSIVNFAIGKLLTDSLINSIDQPVYDFFPEWKQGMKKDITIRHLLNHTSGMQNVDWSLTEIYPSPNFIKLGLAAEITDKPGTKFYYNNKAVNLLAGIVKIASGKRLDHYLYETIFKPLEIEDFDWELDKEGNPHSMAGFKVLPTDLAKLGQLFIQKGKWNGVQLIKENWFTETVTPSALEPTCGLLWWIEYERFSIVDDEQIKKLKTIGFPDSVFNKIMALKGKYLSHEFSKLFAERIVNAIPDWGTKYVPLLANSKLTVSRKETGKIIGYSTKGYLGNCMAIYPDKKLIVVRMITEESFQKGKGTTDGSGYNNLINFFPLTQNLIK